MSQARTLAGRLAGQPVEALRGTKRIVNMYLSQVLAGAMQAGFAAEAITMQSEDHRQRFAGLSANFETVVTMIPAARCPKLPTGSGFGVFSARGGTVRVHR
jgi:hypothetical protein